MQLPILQARGSPASIVAKLLATELGADVDSYVFVDYCAGGGGPTPFIERYINGATEEGENGSSSAITKTTTKKRRGGGRKQPVHFILTDLHPHIPNWTLAATASPNIHFSPHSIDASASPPNLLSTVEPPLPRTLLSSSSPAAAAAPPKTFRTFNLAFHHLPDPLAASVLHDTLRTSSGFAIFELQDRGWRSFLAVCLLGLGAVAFAPYFAWKWRSPGTLFWSWVVPVLPFVLVWDGWMSSVRTRTVEEVEGMMVAAAGRELASAWEVRSGRVMHLPPFAEVNWIIATKRGV